MVCSFLCQFSPLSQRIVAYPQASSSSSGWRRFLKIDQQKSIMWCSYLFCCFLSYYLLMMSFEKVLLSFEETQKVWFPFLQNQSVGTWIANKPKFSKSQKIIRLNSRVKRSIQMKICFSRKFYLFKAIITFSLIPCFHYTD